MKGIITNPKIEGVDLVKIISAAWKNGVSIGVTTPSKQRRHIEIKVRKSVSNGYSCVDVDVEHSGYQLNSIGFEALHKGARKVFFNSKTDSPDMPLTILGTQLLSVNVKKGDESKALAFILDFLENGKYVEKNSKFFELERKGRVILRKLKSGK